jgi:TM2 domain-containing membrane protein YozV
MQSMPVQPPIFFKNPTVATVLSILITGLGQLYNGQILKGIMFLGMMFVSVALMYMTLGTLFFLPLIVWIWCVVDANRSAKRVNQRLAAGASPMEVAQL